jgi:benzoyl-CoA reductase/2-hydroxyglutaryl-CoA dehydratase subunit BcrC/BadD/HgdB
MESAAQIVRTMDSSPEPIIDDEFAGDAGRRIVDYILSRRNEGCRVVGLYCGYAPVEIIRAMGAVPAFLCGTSAHTIPAAESVLPANLCPLIKSSFGFIRTQTCPLYELSEAVIGETTCDGKKKMFELIAEIKPTHVMDLPHLPEEEDALGRWTAMVRKLKEFLEKTFGVEIMEERIEAEIRETNTKCQLMNRVFDYAALCPPVLHWSEMLDVIGFEPIVGSGECRQFIEPILAKLDRCRIEGTFFGKPGSPRVLVSGCPVEGEARKVLRIIEEAGGVIVALEGCGGMKGYSIRVEEDTGDPLAAVASSTLKIPCACMSPNKRRMEALDGMILRFKPDVVIDVILQACHTYNVESYRIERHVRKNHGLPFLKIETDYSRSDIEPLRTRVEALLET